MAGVWYVTPARVKLTLPGAAVVGNIAQVEIHRLTVQSGIPVAEVWRLPGQAVVPAVLSAAVAEQDAGAVPTRETTPTSTSGGTGLTQVQADKLAAAVVQAQLPTYRRRNETTGLYPARAAGGLWDEAMGTVAAPDRVTGDVFHRVVIEP